MAINYKAWVDNNGEIVITREGSYQDLNQGTVRIPGLDFSTSNDGNTTETPPAVHTHVASEITDFNTAVDSNANVTANTAKRSYPLVDENKLATIETNAKDDQNSTEVPYDNSGTSLSSTNVGAALNELDIRTSGAGGLDHGNLAGLLDDDHTQYHNDTRGDARYFTQAQLTTGQLDSRYYTETEITTFLNGKEDKTQKGVVNGYAPLGADGKVPTSFLPATVIGETFSVADIPARDALPVGSNAGQLSSGDVVVVTDASADPDVTTGGATYRWTGFAFVRLLQPDSPVQSVNGFTGVVTLTTSNVTEGSNLYYTDVRVDNNANVSANTTHRGLTNNPHNVTLSQAVSADVSTDVTGAELETLTNAGDASALHNHDGRYYTEAETDTLLADKVTGPASSTDGFIALWDGTTGKLLQDSTATIGNNPDLTLSPNNVPTRSAVQTYVDKDHSWVVTQSGHGFTITNNVPLPARLNSSTVVLAQATTEIDTHAFFITEIIDANNFRCMQSGPLTATSHGLQVGQYYYLDANTAGAATLTVPTISYDDVLWYVIDANRLLLIDNRPVDRESLEKFLIKTQNTDIATNINQAAFTAVPLMGQTVVNESNYYTVAGNTIVISKTRSYHLAVNLHYESVGTGAQNQRVALQGQFFVNGTGVGGIVSHGYIRAANAHQEASLNFTEILPLNAGDVVEFRVRRESDRTGTATMVSAGTSNIIIEAR